jgi:hypothetical protein
MDKNPDDPSAVNYPDVSEASLKRILVVRLDICLANPALCTFQLPVTVQIGYCQMHMASETDAAIDIKAALESAGSTNEDINKQLNSVRT